MELSTTVEKSIAQFMVQQFAHAGKIHCWYDMEVIRFVSLFSHRKARQVHPTVLIALLV